MKLFLMLLTGLSGIQLASAMPVPGISDFPVDPLEPVRFEFNCPKETIAYANSSIDLSRLSKRAQVLALKEIEAEAGKSSKCFVQFNQDGIDVNGMQSIPGKSVRKFWATEQTRMTKYERSWNFMYESSSDSKLRVLSLERTYLWPGPLLEEGGYFDKYFRAWFVIQSDKPS